DFHARPRRRRRGRGGGAEAPMGARAAPAAPPPIVFETAIPGDVPPPLAPYEVPAPADSEQTFDDGLWAGTDTGAGEALPGDAVVDMSDPELAVDGGTAAESGEEAAAADQDFSTGWAAVRDANIRPYVEWRAGVPVTLPVLAARPQGGGGGGQGNHA